MIYLVHVLGGFLRCLTHRISSSIASDGRVPFSSANFKKNYPLKRSDTDLVMGFDEMMAGYKMSVHIEFVNIYD